MKNLRKLVCTGGVAILLSNALFGPIVSSAETLQNPAETQTSIGDKTNKKTVYPRKIPISRKIPLFLNRQTK